jgi:hypothetical protein
VVILSHLCNDNGGCHGRSKQEGKGGAGAWAAEWAAAPLPAAGPSWEPQGGQGGGH